MDRRERRSLNRAANKGRRRDVERGHRDLLHDERRGRPRKAFDDLDVLTDVQPFPLSGPGGMLEQAVTRLRKYEGNVATYNAVAEALRVLRTGASPKRFSQRVREQWRQLLLVRSDIAELEEAIRDCAGIDNQEREVFRSMHLKFGTPGGTQRVAFTVTMGQVERQRRHQAILQRRLAALEDAALPPPPAFEDDVEAMRSLLNFIESLKDEVLMLSDEADAARESKDQKHLNKIRRWRNTVVRDLEYLGVDPRTYADRRAVVVGRAIGRPKQ